MPRIEKSGYRRYWELKQHVGLNPDGSKRVVEGFRDMITGEFHAPKEGWNGSPPKLTTGEKPPELSNDFYIRYDWIKWDK